LREGIREFILAPRCRRDELAFCSPTGACTRERAGEPIGDPIGDMAGLEGRDLVNFCKDRRFLLLDDILRLALSLLRASIRGLPVFARLREIFRGGCRTDGGKSSSNEGSSGRELFMSFASCSKSGCRKLLRSSIGSDKKRMDVSSSSSTIFSNCMATFADGLTGLGETGPVDLFAQFSLSKVALKTCGFFVCKTMPEFGKAGCSSGG